MNIKYDTPIEITKQQFFKVIPRFNGFVAWRRVKGGKYEIKLWNMKFREELEKVLG